MNNTLDRWEGPLSCWCIMSHFDFHNHLEDSDELAHWATSCGHYDELDSGYTVTITDLHKIMHKSIQLAPKNPMLSLHLLRLWPCACPKQVPKYIHSFLPRKIWPFQFWIYGKVQVFRVGCHAFKKNVCWDGFRK